ncbi:TLC domain containing 3Ba isoform X1 [Mobula hypostoma]|uniref:TLC domain containing 3Ba isoform X1 n=2 Tax=Mobula hypostoma TaxID=723540 RepID=UPI002FC2CF00
MGRKVCGDRHCSCAAGGGDMLTELALGSLFFPALFSLCRRCLKQLPVPGWGETDAVILSSRLVSSVQAVMASSAGLIIVRSCRNNILETRHWLTNTYVLFAVPYFAYDIYAMYLCHWHRTRVKGHGVEQEACVSVLRSYLRKDLLMVIHHSVMFTICFPVSVFLRDGRGDYFVGCLFLAEVSTPFVCLGKVLIQYRQQHTLLHKLNGILMLLTFFACRVALFPYLYWAYGQHTGLPLHRVPLELPFHVNLAALTLMAPQLYWFALICRGALRLFRRGRSGRPQINGWAPGPPPS